MASIIYAVASPLVRLAVGASSSPSSEIQAERRRALHDIRNNNVQSIVISYTGYLDYDRQYFLDVVAALEDNTSLKRLEANRINIEDNHITELVNKIRTNKTLKTIILRDNNISNSGAMRLHSVFSDNFTITELDLSNTNSVYTQHTISDGILRQIQSFVQRNIERQERIEQEQKSRQITLEHEVKELRRDVDSNTKHIIYNNTQIQRILSPEFIGNIINDLQLDNEKRMLAMEATFQEIIKNIINNIHQIATPQNNISIQNQQHQIQLISQDPDKKEYFSQIVGGLNSAYIAAMAVQSKIINHDKQGAFGILGQIIDKLSESLPAGTIIGKLVGNMLKKFDYQKNHAQILKIAELANSSSEMENISNKVAIDLIQAFQYINPTPDKDIDNMLDSIFNSKIDKTKDIPGQLVAAAKNKVQTATSKTSGCCVIL